MNILQALDDPKVFGDFFRAGTWGAWRVFLAALFGLQMTEDQLAIYRRFTGRSTPPTKALHEAWLVIGRRGGKSFVLAVIAVFLACFRDWRPFLGPGEVGTVMIIAADRRQARVIMRYCTGLLTAVPMLAKLIEAQSREAIELKNRIVIEIHTASFRTTRGYTIVAALCDELAYWHSDETSAEPDVEVINALRPGMSTVPDAVLLCASSPYARRGALWDAHRRHYGQDGDEVLVWQADTRSMNPSVPQSYIDRHTADDAARASAEYLAQFRSDIEAFIMREVVDACVLRGIFELPPAPRESYFAFCDPSGGSSDSFAVAIGHHDLSRDTICVDCLREIPAPFSPEIAVAELSALLKSYRISSVTGDKYAGEWPREAFSRHHISYEQSSLVKSQLYSAFLPRLNSGQVELLDNARLINQLCQLERRTARGGRDSIDHPAGAGYHDDLANCVAGLCSVGTGSAASYARALKRLYEADHGSGAFEDEVSKWLHLDTPEKIHKAFLEYGPNTPGARSLGSGGYRAPTFEERSRLQAELFARLREAKR
jgi:hypothetical protein